MLHTPYRLPRTYGILNKRGAARPNRTLSLAGRELSLPLVINAGSLYTYLENISPSFDV